MIVSRGGEHRQANPSMVAKPISARLELERPPQRLPGSITGWLRLYCYSVNMIWFLRRKHPGDPYMDPYAKIGITVPAIKRVKSVF